MEIGRYCKSGILFFLQRSDCKTFTCTPLVENGGKTNVKNQLDLMVKIQTRDREICEIFRLQKHKIWRLMGYWIKGMEEVKNYSHTSDLDNWIHGVIITTMANT